MKRFRAICLVATIMSVSSGCQKAVVSGQVLDQFQKPVPGVNVTVEKTAFSATSDAGGKYAVEFVPGQFAVKYAKPGFSTIRVELNVAQKAAFPAQPITLFSIPEKKGFLYVGRDAYLQLLGRRIDREEAVGSMSADYRYHTTVDKLPRLDSGTVRFLTIVKEEPELLRLGKRFKTGLLLRHVINRLGLDDIQYNAPQKGEVTTIGEEKLTVRSYTLQPGIYAFVLPDSGPTLFSQTGLSRACFPFLVDTADGGYARSLDTYLKLLAAATGIEGYHGDYKKYPVSESCAELRKLIEPTYLKEFSGADGWGNPLVCRVTADGYELKSLGADGKADATPQAGAWRPERDWLLKNGMFVQAPDELGGAAMK